MRFRIEQSFPGALDAVEDAFCDPEFLRQVSVLPKVGGVELLDQRTEDGRVHQRVRYRFSGHLSPAVTAVVNPDKLTWVEESVLDRSTHITTWRIVPDNYADRLSCRGTFTLLATGDDATLPDRRGGAQGPLPARRRTGRAGDRERAGGARGRGRGSDAELLVKTLTRRVNGATTVYGHRAVR